jgi:hypothetical protein
MATLLRSHFFRQTMETHSNFRSPAALSALPDELLFIIFWFLTRPDLLNLCYIRRFRNVAQDVLYQEFHTDGQNLALFSITILPDKTLASRVRRVYIKEPWDSKDVQEYKGSFIALLTHHLRCLNIPSHVKRIWARKITHRRALAALLLYHLPKLERLEISAVGGIFLRDMFHVGPPYWTFLMNTSLVQASFLRNIRELSLKGPSCSVRDLAEIFSLPSLRSLRMSAVYQSERDQGLTEWMFQPRSNCITTLALTDSKISRQTLRRVLRSCTALKDLTYTEIWNCDREGEDTFTWVTQDFDSLIKSLSPFHETLRTLKLQNKPVTQIPTKHSPIRTLTQFTSLEHFSTVMFAIKNHGGRIQEILPESLIELELSDTSQSFLETYGDDVSDGDDVNDGDDVSDGNGVNDGDDVSDGNDVNGWDDVDDMLWGLSEAKLDRLPNLTRVALTLDDWYHSNLEFERRSINGVEFYFGRPKYCLVSALDFDLFWETFESCPSTPTSDTLHYADLSTDLLSIR